METCLAINLNLIINYLKSHLLIQPWTIFAAIFLLHYTQDGKLKFCAPGCKSYKVRNLTNC